MKFRVFVAMPLVLAILLTTVVLPAWAGGYEFSRLTDNQTDDNQPVLNNRGRIAWLTNTIASRLWPHHILSYYDGETTVFLPEEFGKKVSWQSINDHGQISYVNYDPANWQDSSISLIDGRGRLLAEIPGEIAPYFDNNRRALHNNFLLWYNSNEDGCGGESCRHFQLYDISGNKNIDLEFTEGMDWLDINNSGHVVWRSAGSVMFFDGTETRSLGAGNYPSINNNNQILWLAEADNLYRLYDYPTNQETVTNISGDDTFGMLFRFNDAGQIAWIGSDPAAEGISLYLSDGFRTAVIPVPTPINPYSFHLNDRGQVAWIGYDPADPAGENHAFIYDGAKVIQLEIGVSATHVYSLDFNDNGDLVLSASDGEDAEIFFAKAPRPDPVDLD